MYVRNKGINKMLYDIFPMGNQMEYFMIRTKIAAFQRAQV